MYRAYPNLANISVYAMLKDMNGLYSPKFGGVIKIPKKYVNRNGDIVKKHVEAYMVQLRTTLLHEIQHAIQCIEGFALGSIPQNFRKEFEDTKDQVCHLSRLSTANAGKQQHGKHELGMKY